MIRRKLTGYFFLIPFVGFSSILCLFQFVPVSKAHPVSNETAFSRAILTSWYDPHWLYRREIAIDNSHNAIALTAYQVQISLSSANFTFSHAQSSGQDVRFTDSDGVTTIDYWIESYSAVGNVAVIYVKVPSIPASSTKHIFLYYGDPTASPADNGYSVFNLYDGFESSALTSAAYYQTTPTYDGSGQATSPDIVEFPLGWHGYKFWMAMTPYPGGKDAYENPSILVSNNGSNWVVPAGLRNPLVPRPPCDHNNDTDMIYNSGTHELWMYFSDTRRAARCAGYANQPWYNHNRVKLIKSVDGIHWTAPQTVIDWNLANSPLYISPAVVHVGSAYYMWVSNASTYKVSRLSSATGSIWSAPQSVSLSNLAWHLNVMYVPSTSQYLLLTDHPSGKGALRFATSTNGLSWKAYSNPVLLPTSGWDANPYRAAFTYDTDTRQFRMWYSAYSSTTVWHIGYTQTNYSNFIGQLSVSRWSKNQGTGTWTTQKIQVKRGISSAQLTQTGSTYGTSMLVSKNEPLATNFYQEWDMYDDMDSTAFKVVRNANATGNEIGMGVWTGLSTTRYVYHAKGYIYTTTSVARTRGWHKFVMLFKSDLSVTFFIDGRRVGTITGQYANATQSRIEGYHGGTTTYYVDNMRIRQWTNPEPNILIAGEQNQ